MRIGQASKIPFLRRYSGTAASAHKHSTAQNTVRHRARNAADPPVFRLKGIAAACHRCNPIQCGAARRCTAADTPHSAKPVPANHTAARSAVCCRHRPPPAFQRPAPRRDRCASVRCPAYSGRFKSSGTRYAAGIVSRAGASRGHTPCRSEPKAARGARSAFCGIFPI